jgi:predicted enzyme related to lactoylglutathione lyase
MAAASPLEGCRLIDDDRACALEYNVVRWGKTELPPQGSIGVYVRGQSGQLAAARIYDDVDPPLSSHM